MTKVKAFLDTNVFIDVLLGIRPSTDASAQILEAVRLGLIEATLSTQSILDAAYAVRKQSGKQEFYHFTEWAISHINMDYITSFDIAQAIRDNSGDFEDDAQYSLAISAMCDYYVTSDKKLIARHKNGDPEIQVITPEEFVVKLKAKSAAKQS